MSQKIFTGKTKSTIENSLYVVGIDVSRNKLDYAVLKGTEFLFHYIGKNEPEDIAVFVNKLIDKQQIPIDKIIFCMENTGIYCNHLIEYLYSQNAILVVEHPLKIKNSLGIARGKNDRIDALRIARYALKNEKELKIWQPKRDVIIQLMVMTAIRSRLVTILGMLKTPLQEEKTFVSNNRYQYSKLSCQSSSDAIANEIKQIQKTIDLLVSNDTRIKTLKELIISVPGVGPITAIQIIISTNEFRDIQDPKKFASYAGVAPFMNESGKLSRRARVSHIANKKIKVLLHISALAAVRSNKELRQYYERKTKEEGKPKMAVLNAIRNKLILRVFSCVRNDRKFVNEYRYAACPIGDQPKSLVENYTKELNRQRV